MTAQLDADFQRCFASGQAIEAVFRRPATDFSVTALIGPSGCGKTTVLRCLAGLDRPARGRITFGDEVWFDAGRNVCRRPQARGIGYLFQEYALFPHLTVAGNVAFGLTKMTSDEKARRVGELLDMLQLGGLQKRYPHQLSGGQQQRVALARTVAARPRLLLLDEPLSALDAPTRNRLRAELQRLLAQWAIPTILVTHDPLEVEAVADYVVVLCDGRVRQQGPLGQVYGHPADDDVAQIIGRA